MQVRGERHRLFDPRGYYAGRFSIVYRRLQRIQAPIIKATIVAESIGVFGLGIDRL